MGPSRSQHAQASHARLHKRGNSASSITSPSALSPLSDSAAFTFNRSETPKVTYEEPWIEPTRPMPSATSSSSSKDPLKIKPYLRKLSAKDAQSLDLSRPAAENEGLAGLGITEYSRSVSEVSFTGMNSRGRHNRSTSNTSQFSTSSSLRPTVPYMPPIRQTPRPYTPPISKSTPSSMLGSEHEGDDIMSEEEFRLRQNAFDPARRSGSMSSTPGTTPGLRIHTTGSSTRLGGSYSQSTVSLTSPVAQSRARGDTLKSIDTTSPSSRTSFDKAFGFIRGGGGRDSPVDAASRAASIRAARQAFQEKEEAKSRKQDKEALKKEERDYRKQYKKSERRKSDALEQSSHKRSRSISDSNTNKTSTPRASLGGSRPSIGGREYSDHRQAHTRSLPAQVITLDPEKRPVVQPQVTRSRAAKGRWMRFVTWFKTRILRMSSRLHVSS